MGKYKKISFLTLIIALFTLQQCDKQPQITCNTYDTDKFLGYYNVSEACTQSFNGVTFGTIVEGNSTALNHITFINFNNTGTYVDAYVGCTEISDIDGSTTIYFRIPDQNLNSSASSIVGEGYYTETNGYSQLDFNVTLTQNGIVDQCNYRYIK